MSDPLIRFKQRPDARGFEALVRSTSRAIVTAAHRVVGDRQLAEDVAQEVYMKALDEDWPGKPIRSGFGLLISTAILKAKTLVRSESRRRAREEEAASRTERPDSLPVEDAWAIRDAILELDPSLGRPMELHFFGGLEARDIAALTQVSPRTVRDQIQRGRDEIRRRWDGALWAAAMPALEADQLPQLAPGREWIESVVESGATVLNGRPQPTTSTHPAARRTASLSAVVIVLTLGIFFGPSTWSDFTSSTESASDHGGPTAAGDAVAAHDNGMPAAGDDANHKASANDLASNSAQPERASAITPSTSLVIEVRDDNGKLVEDGELYLGGTEESAERIAATLRENETLQREFEWLLRPLALSEHNPLRLAEVPEPFVGLEISVRTAVPGHAPAGGTYRIAAEQENRWTVSVVEDVVASEANELGALSLLVEVVDAHGQLVRDGTLRIDGGLALMILAADTRVGIELAPFAWLDDPLDLAIHNPLVVEGLPARLAEVTLNASVESPLGVARPVRFKIGPEGPARVRMEVSVGPQLSVEVTDNATGHAIVNAVVLNRTVFDTAGRQLTGVPEVGPASARTDASGLARVSIGPGDEQSIYLSAPGYRSRDITVETPSGEPADRVVASLEVIEETGSIEAHVVDHEGQGVAGHVVTLRIAGDRVPRELATDPTGRVHFRDVPTGQHHVSVDRGKLRKAARIPSGSGLKSRADVMITPNRTAEITLGCAGRSTLVGIVRDFRGAPLPFVRIGVFGPSEADLRTGFDGRVTAEHLAAGNYKLVIDRASGHFPINVNVTLAEDERVEREWTRGVAAVRGRVDCERELFMSYARLIHANGDVQSSMIDSDGTFEIGRVAPGRYRLETDIGDHAPTRTEVEIVGTTSVEGLELRPSPDSVLTVTFDPRIESFAIDITVRNLLGTALEPTASGGGWWRRGKLVAETHTIELRAPDGRTATHTVSLGDDEERQMTFDPTTLQLRQP